MSDNQQEKVRLDKWLWAARFYKTRALAKEAIEGGKVHCRGERCKPSKEPKVGDELVLRAGYDERTVVIEQLSAVRRGAPQAQLLDRKSTRLNSSHVRISYAVFCLKKKKTNGCRPFSGRRCLSTSRPRSGRRSLQ